jgi:peptide/nickel transport system permease protein
VGIPNINPTQPKIDLSTKGFPEQTWWKTGLNFLRRKPLGSIGGIILLIFIFIAIFAPQLAPNGPFRMDSNRILVAPQAGAPLGTDEFGRDILSRLIWGARISLFVGLMAVGLGTTTGAVLGLLGGYYGGRIDFVIQRAMDTLLAFPMLVLALAMIAALGPSIANVILALAVVVMPSTSRVIRSSVLVIRETTFIEAARSVGVSDFRLIFRHVLPNCVAPFIIIATAGLGSAILSEASLSFLGLGVPSPEPSWGAMLSGSTQRYMYRAPWLAIYPGLAISLAVFGFNFLGDALRDILDPKLRKR